MASCEMPGALPPHKDCLPASELTPEARARRMKFHGIVREQRIAKQNEINEKTRSMEPPKTLAEARERFLAEIMPATPVVEPEIEAPKAE